MLVKIRVMKDCIVIPQSTRELWGCAEGLSVVHFNKKKMPSRSRVFWWG
jgi:toxic protein SymE